MRRVFLLLLASITVCLVCGSATAQDICNPEPIEPICGDEERIQYQELAADGVPADELNAMFEHCASDGVAPSNQKTITVNNGVGSTFYEQMNGCGYHPQIGVAMCDVELKRDTWYGTFPAGSTENVTFCFQCGGANIPVLGTVHVTNDFGSVAAPSYGFTAYAFAPPQCPPPGSGTGASFRVIATLSWAVPATGPCTNNPGLVWGNRITFDARNDP